MWLTMYKNLCRTLREHPLMVDTILALVVVVFLALVSVGGAIREGQAASTMVVPALLSAVTAAPVAVRRRLPCATLGASLALVFLVFAVTSPAPPVMLPVAIALYTVGTMGDRKRTLLSTAAAIAVVSLIRLLFSRGDMLAEELVRDVAWIVGATAVGFAIANRRAYIDEFRRRALEAERTREEEAQRRVNEERLRIARDVHDGVAHALASISLQASAAAAVIEELCQGGPSMAGPFIHAAFYGGLNISENGSKEQKEALLPKLARQQLGLGEAQRGAYLGLLALSLIAGGVLAL
jgi:signal transduction histidine kinase